MENRIEFRNARVYDGSGGSPTKRCIQITDGRIERVGQEPIGDGQAIDLSGAAVAPGFIDMHAHSELHLFEHPNASEKLTQGITLEILGQDGISVAPIPQGTQDEWANRLQSLLGTKDEWNWQSVEGFLDALEALSPAVNCAYYTPHGNLRSLVAGFEDRPLTDDELGRICDVLDTAIDAGAFAMSKGMIYPPSSHGHDSELESLGKILASRDTFMVSHVWNESDRVVESIDRFVSLCERAGCQPHVSHLKVAGEENWGRSEEILSLFDDANERGVHVTFDQYPWTAGSTMLTALLPPWTRAGETDAVTSRLADPESRERIQADIESDDGEWENLAKSAGSWDNILITATDSGRAEGKTLAELSVERKVGPVEAMCDLLVEEDLAVTMADFVMDDVDIERFLADERGTICTDGIFGGKPHPRAVGTYPRLLGRYVRERDSLSLSTAIYKAAGHPADVLGLPDRGRVWEGYVADLVIFEPERVQSNATYDNPMIFSDGIKHVLVNGEFVIENGEPTGVRSGSVLRSTDEWDGTNRPDLRSR
ncbi:urease [Haladaptatus sp. W1]|uniref:N-acyl-D-amino-acid deacylase family protein n=1 Tax=Haladaptatus sp. W1 TaxID=1897478 RepID=UPI0008499A56|nr:D-aminoacylase [Haladaptatus sp. W1]ODR80240.1 urease [Haladaptatus sp. W1]